MTITKKSCRFVAMNLRELSREELEKEFEARKRALIEVRDELDRRDRWVVKPGANVDFTKYVENGDTD